MNERKKTTNEYPQKKNNAEREQREQIIEVGVQRI